MGMARHIMDKMGGFNKETGLPNFMNNWDYEGNPIGYYSDSEIYFENFQEAKEWALRNPGKAFTRSANGKGFSPK